MVVVSFVVVDPNASPCLCLDVLSRTRRPRLTVSDVGFRTSSFLHRRKPLLYYGSTSSSSSSDLKKKKKKRSRGGFVVVGELAGQYEDSFEDVKRQIVDYFTYKAVRTVLNQLYEMDPNQYRWFYDYVASNDNGYGKHFIRNLVKDKQNLAERVMVTRLHLYGKWIKKCDHTEMYDRISDQNLELMRERLIETVIWPSSDDPNTS